MEEFKTQIKSRFASEIDNLDLTLDIDSLEIRYNSIVEEILDKIRIKKENNSIPMSQTTNNNIYGTELDLCAGKSSETLINDNTKPITNKREKEQVNQSTSIANNFSLNYEMKQFAKSKFIQNVEETFENFKLYYQSKGTLNSDWEAVWKRWVLNQNRYKNHLIKTTIDEELELKNNFLEIAQNYLAKKDRELEFTKFKNHYIANGDLKTSWEKVWENWCINHKQFKPREQSQKSKEKQEYKWDFRKAKDVSDRIKDWLEFEKGINWLDDFYWKGKTIPGIGWQKVMHPDFNKEEILLFKIDSVDGNYMIQYQSDEIIEAEVLEND
jgi:hypothetical protein